jgi:hypothetical protein
MDAVQFRDFVKGSAFRTVRGNGRIGGLVLTQTVNRAPKIREPEMRHALAQEAEARNNVLYGIEVPTRQRYRFTTVPGNGTVAARHDFVVMKEPCPAAARLNLMELKEGQRGGPVLAADADCLPIRKDFQKLMLEVAEQGKSIMHILQAVDADTISSLLGKYNIAVRRAVSLPREQARLLSIPDPLLDSVWFTLFILVVHHRKESDRPFLYHQHLENFGAALQQAEKAEPLFREQCLVREPLDERIALSPWQESGSSDGMALTPDDVDQRLIARGLLSRLPDSSQDLDDEEEDDQPIPVEGEPVSETIIRERR